MKCYKLTDWEMCTREGFQYTLGNWTQPLWGKDELCTSHWYHVYDHPLIAALFWPVHISLPGLRLFECTYDGRCRTLDDNGLKRGVVSLRPDEEITLPEVDPVQRARFAIYCVMDICKTEAYWQKWAENWLRGEDRYCKTAKDVSWAVYGDIRRSCPHGMPTVGASRGLHAAQFACDAVARIYGRGCRGAAERNEVARQVAEAAVNSLKAIQDVRRDVRKAAYWVDLAERANADEDKLQAETTA